MLSTRSSHRSLQHAFGVVVGCCLAVGLVRAGQQTKFEEARDNLYKQARAEQQRTGLANDAKKLYADYPCPELPLFKVQDVAPGATVPLLLNGKFPRGTTFLADVDGATLTGTLAGNTFTGRLAIAPSQPPGFVHLYAFTPVSNASAMIPVAFINSAYAFDLRGANGWTIKATPAANRFTVTDTNASLAYRVEFTRAGEAKPFQTMSGQLSYPGGSSASPDVDISLQEESSGAVAEMQALSKQMSDPQTFMKMTQAQQNALIERLSRVQEQMMKELMAGASDPAAAQKKQDDFGCRGLRVRPGASGSASGEVSCGRNVNNGLLNATGTASVMR